MSTYKLQKFAERLKERRDAMGFSNEQLARMAGIGARSIYDYLDQTTTPKGDTIVKLSEVLQCDIGWLFGEERASAPVTYPAHREEVLELSERLEQVRAAVDATQAVIDTMSEKEPAPVKPAIGERRNDPAFLKKLATAHPLRSEVSERKPRAASTTDSKSAPRPPALKRPSTPPPAPIPVPTAPES